MVRNLFHVLHLALRTNRLGVLGLFLIISIVVVAVFAPKIAPYSPSKLDVTQRLQPPSLKHLFGTDTGGRDIFSRIIYGSRISLAESMVVIMIALSIGTLVGSTAGFFGGWLDELLMRFTDVFLAFPGMILAMAVNAALGPGIKSAVLAVSITWWPSYARMIRGQVMATRNNIYVDAARALGASNWRMLAKHILPNCISPIIVQLTLDAGAVLLTIAGLSFIGLGAQPPTPEWGAMVNEGKNYIMSQWWCPTFPGLAICLLVIGFNTVGDLVRDIMDPRLRRSKT